DQLEAFVGGDAAAADEKDALAHGCGSGVAACSSAVVAGSVVSCASSTAGGIGAVAPGGGATDCSIRAGSGVGCSVGARLLAVSTSASKPPATMPIQNTGI